MVLDIEYRICKTCNENKLLTFGNWQWRSDTNEFRKQCKLCISKRKLLYYSKNNKIYSELSYKTISSSKSSRKTISSYSPSKSESSGST